MFEGGEFFMRIAHMTGVFYEQEQTIAISPTDNIPQESTLSVRCCCRSSN